jgi:Xaa-Pro aminopeptidase
VKSASEIEVMKASAEISARAHAKVSELYGRVVLSRYILFFWLTRGREK